MSPPKVRKAPARAPIAETFDDSRKPSRDNLGPASPQDHVADLAALDACLSTALDYERHLARKQYRVRRLVLNLQAKLDHLDEIGEILGRGA